MVTCTTSSQYTESHRLVKGVHEIVQKNPTDLNDKIFFFFFLPPTLTLRAGGSTKVLFHVATFRSLQDTAANTTVILSSAPSPSHWSYDRRGCWKNVKGALKTKRLQALWTVTAEQLVAASGDCRAQRFFTEETPCFHGRWNLEREREKKKNFIEGTRTNRERRGAFVILPSYHCSY